MRTPLGPEYILYRYLDPLGTLYNTPEASQGDSHSLPGAVESQGKDSRLSDFLTFRAYPRGLGFRA